MGDKELGFPGNKGLPELLLLKKIQNSKQFQVPSSECITKTFSGLRWEDLPA